jgi:hypothetical protein
MLLRLVLPVALFFMLTTGCNSDGPSAAPSQRSEQKSSSMTLQQRAKAFLERPVPKGMPYVSDSISERFIAEYAATGKVKLDIESLELLQLCVLEGDNAAQQKQGAEREFFLESAAILRAILNESRESR